VAVVLDRLGVLKIGARRVDVLEDAGVVDDRELCVIGGGWCCECWI
jgi:hypothetical protein